MSTKMREMLASNQYIAHLELPKRTILNQLPKIENETNREYITEKLKCMENKMGLLSA